MEIYVFLLACLLLINILLIAFLGYNVQQLQKTVKDIKLQIGVSDLC